MSLFILGTVTGLAFAASVAAGFLFGDQMVAEVKHKIRKGTTTND